MANVDGQPAATSVDVESKKVNRPSDSRLKQQKLKAWQPILTAGTVLPTFFVIGIIFIPIGSVLLVASNNVSEYVYDYTLCNSTSNPNSTCKDELEKSHSANCKCSFQIEIKEYMKDPIYIYYGLTNFYQNHRRYVKSRDDKQLLGQVSVIPADSSNDCAPFRENANKTAIAPCGAIANSMFNDSFSITQQGGSVIPLDYTKIAWPSDYSYKFDNPQNMSIFNLTERPPSWNRSANQLSSDVNENGFKNESFIVWMRVSALPTFRKLHSRVNQPFTKDTVYTIRVDYNYPVFEFDGKKKIIISTTSWAGGKNPFLGVAYIVVGCLCILTGMIFFFIHLKFGKTLTEMANIGR